MPTPDQEQQPGAALSAEDLDEIEARANAATPGPWQWDGFDDVTIPSEDCPQSGAVVLAELSERDGEHWIMTPVEVTMQGLDPAETGGETEAEAWAVWINQADAEFIAHAREDIPALLALARQAAALPDVIAALRRYMATDAFACGCLDCDEEPERLICCGECLFCHARAALDALGEQP
jgi:hypothetical protein